MTPLALVLVALAVSADAFAVSVSKGLGMRRLDVRAAVSLAAAFGAAQAMMPLIGWALASRLDEQLAAVDHWIAFTLLTGMGAKLLWEAWHHDASAGPTRTSGIEVMVLAVATSIDALAVGVTFAVVEVHVLPAVALIGGTTAVLCLLGVVVGQRAGSRLGGPAEALGGLVLMALGLKVVLDHLGLS